MCPKAHANLKDDLNPMFYTISAHSGLETAMVANYPGVTLITVTSTKQIPRNIQALIKFLTNARILQATTIHGRATPNKLPALPALILHYEPAHIYIPPTTSSPASSIPDTAFLY